MAKFVPNPAFIARLGDAKVKSLRKTGEAVRTDLVQSQTMPFDTGTLQNDSTFVDESRVGDGKVTLVSSTPYARRLYFHPEYNFQRGKNPNAGGRWLDPYVMGAKRLFVQNAFTKFLREALFK